MRLNSVIWIAGFVILAQSAMVSAQQKSSELNEVEDRLIRSFQERFANWTRTTVTPIEGSEDVAISKWKLNDNEMSVTIIRYSSEEGALARIRQFADDMKAERDISEGADEAYSLNTQKNSVTLRKRHFIVNIHVNMTEASGEKQLVKESCRHRYFADKHTIASQGGQLNRCSQIKKSFLLDQFSAAR